jgi:hypothetical protein
MAKQMMVLKHGTDLLSVTWQARISKLPDVHVVDQNLTARGSVQAQQQLEKSALARPGVAGKKSYRAFVEGYRYVVQRLGTIFEALADVVEFDTDDDLVRFAKRPR